MHTRLTGNGGHPDNQTHRRLYAQAILRGQLSVSEQLRAQARGSERVPRQQRFRQDLGVGVLQKIQALVTRSERIAELFPVRDLALGQDRKEQHFEIDTGTDEYTYRYGLTIEHEPDRNLMRISKGDSGP